MIAAIKSYMKEKSTIMAFAIAISFQIIFSVIWMTAYKDVTTNLPQLTIGIVVDNEQNKEDIISTLTESLTFPIQHFQTITNARKQLNHRNIQLIAHIHNDSLQNIDHIEYILNDSNPSFVHNTMTSVAASMDQLLMEKGEQFQTPPLEVIHPVDTFSEKQVPFMVLITFFVSAMIGNMNLLQTSMLLKNKFPKLMNISARLIVLAIMAVIVSFALNLCLLQFTSLSEGHFFTLWLYLAISMFIFLLLAQISVLLFKAYGIFLNLIFLAAQIVTSGALVPLNLLPSFYQIVGQLLPAHHMIEGLMNLTYGGPNLLSAFLTLLLFVIVLAGVNLLIVFIQAPYTVKNRDTAQTNIAQ